MKFFETTVAGWNKDTYISRWLLESSLNKVINITCFNYIHNCLYACSKKISDCHSIFICLCMYRYWSYVLHFAKCLVCVAFWWRSWWMPKVSVSRQVGGWPRAPLSSPSWTGPASQTMPTTQPPLLHLTCSRRFLRWVESSSPLYMCSVCACMYIVDLKDMKTEGIPIIITTLTSLRPKKLKQSLCLS